MSSIFSFLLVLVPLVVIHELGHFLMAKLGGIHVTRFAFGFGTRLFGFEYKGTDYRWNLIPLGGYVDFMGEAIYTGKIPDDVTHFYNRPKWLRFLVLLMGPLFNMLLAFGLYWFIFVARPYGELIPVGEGVTVGVVAEESNEAEAGILVGDRIISFNGEPVEDWDALFRKVVLSPSQDVTLLVERDGLEQEIIYEVEENSKDGSGILNMRADYRMRVHPLDGKPAFLAGVESEDVITHVNGVPVTLHGTGENSIREQITARAPDASSFTFLRDGEVIDPILIKPEKNTEGEWMVGIRLASEARFTNLGIQEAFHRAWEECKDGSTIILKAVYGLVNGELSIKMLSGPIDVARVSKDAFDAGPFIFLGFMALLSLNLGIMNLLPIPVLDGGEIFVLFVEWITRRDFSIETKMKIKIVGFFFLMGIMAIVIFNDFFKF